jgi:hypothetical protein
MNNVCRVNRRQTGPGALQIEIRCQKRRNALNRDLHIGPGIAIHIGLENPAGKAQLPGDPGEGAATNKGKGLIARQPPIRINGGQINPIPFGPAEICDHITDRPRRTIGKG